MDGEKREYKKQAEMLKVVEDEKNKQIKISERLKEELEREKQKQSNF